MSPGPDSIEAGKRTITLGPGEAID